MKRNLEWANDLKWERLDYIWVDVPEMQAKALEPVFEMVNDASVCYIPQNEGVAKVTVCDLEDEDKHLVILAMYSPLVIKAGNNTKTFKEYLIPQIIVKDVISRGESALEYLTQPVDTLKKGDLEGDNYLARLLENKEKRLQLPRNYQFIKSVVEELKKQSVGGVIERIPGFSISRQMCKRTYNEAEISLYLDLKAFRQLLKKRANVKTMFSRNNYIELQLKQTVDQESLFVNTILAKFTRRSGCYEEGTRIELISEEDTVVLTSKETAVEPYGYYTTVKVTTKLTVLIKPVNPEKNVQIHTVELPESYVIGQILDTFQMLLLDYEIPSSEDLTD